MAVELTWFKFHRMQHLPFNKKFTDQFRDEWIYCPSFQESAFEQLRFRQFAGRHNEVPVIGYQILERISDASIIKGIMEQLEQETIPNAFNLLCVIQPMHETFQSYARHEPNSTGYIQEVLDNLQPFYSLIYFCRKKMQSLLDKLQWVMVTEMNFHDREIFCEALENIHDEIALCKNEIDIYYNYFYTRLDKNTDHVRRITLSSKADLHLLQLVTYAEVIINSMDYLQLLWEGWHLTNLVLESQEMYN
jgi:hypothetical protein